MEDCFEKVIYFENLNEHKPFSPPPYLPEASSKFSRDDNYLKSLWESPNGPHVCCKPQKEAFLRALDMAGANPAETVSFPPKNFKFLGACPFLDYFFSLFGRFSLMIARGIFQLLKRLDFSLFWYKKDKKFSVFGSEKQEFNHFLFIFLPSH